MPAKAAKSMAFRWRRLAGQLLPRAGVKRRALAAGLCLALVGCLVPQDDHVLQDLPQVNHPPRIAEDSVQPQPRIITTGNDPSCPSLQFSAAVEDPDLADRLFYYWYVSDLDSPTPVEIAENVILNPTGQERRKDPAQLVVDFNSPSQFQVPGVHVLELLVADGAVINHEPQPRDVPLDGGTGVLTYAATYAWVVNVTSGTCP